MGKGRWWKERKSGVESNLGLEKWSRNEDLVGSLLPLGKWNCFSAFLDPPYTRLNYRRQIFIHVHNLHEFQSTLVVKCVRFLTFQCPLALVSAVAFWEVCRYLPHLPTSTPWPLSPILFSSGYSFCVPGSGIPVEESTSGWPFHPSFPPAPSI